MTTTTSADALLKNVPPHSIEAERAVLGALLVDPVSIDEIATLLTPEQFYKPAHATIYQMIRELSAAGRPIDVVLLNEALAQKGILEQVGGTPALAELSEVMISAANAPYYANIVRDHAARRELIRATAEVQQDAFDTGIPTDEVLDRSEKKLFEVTQKRIKSEAVPVNTVVQEIFKHLELIKEGNGVNGIACGFADIDDLSQGFRPRTSPSTGAPRGSSSRLAGTPATGRRCRRSRRRCR
jgi:replicative DNA helicase